MKGFSTSGWMTSTDLLDMIPENLQNSISDWTRYQESVKDADQAVRSKYVSRDMRITASEDGQKFRLHKRLKTTQPA